MSKETTVINEKYQLISILDETVSESPYQVILVYLSSGCDLSQVVDHLFHLLIPEMTTIVTGDFNFDTTETNDLTTFLKDNLFSQVVPWPTHIQGRTLNHCYGSRNVNVQFT